MNYYNENDPFAAAWLRNLIAANHISPGVVDERSIADVRPQELEAFNQCHFFAGVGVWSYALRQAGWPDDRPVWTGSCPCQSFSAAGQRKGFDDVRHLWPTWFKLIDQCRPLAIFGEQVASKDALAWLDLVHADLEGADYAVGAVDTCAAGFGAPHIRQRFYWVAHTKRSQLRAIESGSVREAAAGVQGADEQREWIRDDLGEHGAASELEKSRCSQRPGRSVSGPTKGDEKDGSGASDITGGPSDSHLMGHADETGPQGRCISGNGSHELPAGPTSMAGGMALPNGRHSGNGNLQRNGEHGLFAPDAGISGMGEPESISGQNGQTTREGSWRPASASYWSDTEWLPCIDGKARPVEPGTFPLAHGAPSRVGRLRGYGNALVAPQATEFIRAYLDVTNVQS